MPLNDHIAAMSSSLRNLVLGYISVRVSIFENLTNYSVKYYATAILEIVYILTTGKSNLKTVPK